jgi:hypothetical protein
MAGPFKFSPGAGTGWNMLAAGFQGAAGIPQALIQGPFLDEDLRKQQALNRALNLGNDAAYMQSMEGLIPGGTPISAAAFEEVPEQLRGAFGAPDAQGMRQPTVDWTASPAARSARQLAEGQTQNFEANAAANWGGLLGIGAEAGRGRPYVDPFTLELYKAGLGAIFEAPDIAGPPALASPAINQAMAKAEALRQAMGGGASAPVQGGVVQPGRQPRPKPNWESVLPRLQQ